MKLLLFLLSLIALLNAENSPKEDEYYFTAYLHSIHFTKNKQTNSNYNEKHKSYGLEYINKEKYTFSYNHFVNSRANDVDAFGLGYLFHFNDEFGLQIISGYQKGYCFDNIFLSSVECTNGLSNESAFVLPLLYYKYKYVKIDLFSNGDMFSFRFNLKVY